MCDYQRGFSLLGVLLQLRYYTTTSKYVSTIMWRGRNLKGNAVVRLGEADLQILRAKMLKGAQKFVWPPTGMCSESLSQIQYQKH